jgi:amidase
MEELLGFPATRQASLIRERKVSSRELVEEHLRQIASINPTINAVVDLFAESALIQAAAADKAIARGEAVGHLHGVPFSIKDSLEVAGTRTTAGTVGRREAPPSVEDATLVTRLRSAGAIPLAKTNLPDLLFAFESDNLLFGRTNNPYDPTRTSGGSSGGEAALIAAGGSPIGLGSDCAGSVRLPAAFCGIAGIKPTSGRLARTGHYPPSGGWLETLWQIGPMARHVDDLCTMMRLLVGGDGRDFTVIDMPFRDPAEIRLRDARIAFYTDNGFTPAGPEVARVVEAAATQLASDGARVEEARPPGLVEAYDLEMQLIGPDGGDALREFLKSVGSHQLHPLLTGWLDKLERYRTDMAGFGLCWARLDRYRTEMLAFFRNYDAILCPVYPQPALPHGTSTLEENFRGFSHTMAYNVAGWPAAVVRCGESDTGLPIGVQVVAHPFREDVALALATRLEEAFGGWKAPNLFQRQVSAR